MIFYGSSFSESDMKSSRENGLGLEIVQYAHPIFLDDFEAQHPIITRYIEGLCGVSMHGAYYDTAYTSIDPLIQEVSRKRFLQSIQAANFHGINKLVFHSVYKPQVDGFSLATLDSFSKRSIEFWQRFEEHIPDGMTIFIENIADECPEVFMKMIRGIGSPKIRACLDIGHAYASSAVPLDEWICVLGDSIGHVHIHDNDGKADQHLPLGRGKIPLADTINAIMKHAGKDVPFVLECDASISLEWLKNIFTIA